MLFPSFISYWLENKSKFYPQILHRHIVFSLWLEGINLYFESLMVILIGQFDKWQFDY
jgi:hypothetical protein